MQKLCQKIVRFLIIFIFILTLISFLICNVIFMKNYPESFSVHEWVWAFPTIIAVFITIIVCHHLAQNNASKLALIIGFVIQNTIYVTLIITNKSVPNVDWEYVWTAAIQMARGTFTDGITNGTYMHEIPYQIGLAYFESFFVRIFGEIYVPLQVFNIILMNLITFGIYKFALRKSNPTTAIYCYILASTFLSLNLSVGQFTNHQLSAILLLIVFYLFEKDTIFSDIGSGLILAILNFLRPLASIVIIAMVCQNIYNFIKNKNLKKTILKLCTLLGSYIIVIFLLDMLMINLGYTDTRISQSSRNMYHKITKDLYESKVDDTIADFDYDYEAYNEAYKDEIISEIKKHPTKTIISMANRFCRYLGLYDYSYGATFDTDLGPSPQTVKALYSIQWFQYILFAIFSGFGYICYCKENELDIYQIFFLGNTYIYLFIEAFTTYRFIGYMYFIFLSGYGMHILIPKIYLYAHNLFNK